MSNAGPKITNWAQSVVNDPWRAMTAIATMGGSEVVTALAKEAAPKKPQPLTAAAAATSLPPPVMPTMDTEAIAAVRRRYTARMQGYGRQSTVLTTPNSDSLGAG